MNTIPRVLNARKEFSAISTERALKQIRELLERVDPIDDRHEDRLNASMDDIDFMLSCLE